VAFRNYQVSRLDGRAVRGLLLGLTFLGNGSVSVVGDPSQCWSFHAIGEFSLFLSAKKQIDAQIK
jgi:hypothetical protein